MVWSPFSRLPGVLCLQTTGTQVQNSLIREFTLWSNDLTMKQEALLNNPQEHTIITIPTLLFFSWGTVIVDTFSSLSSSHKVHFIRAEKNSTHPTGSFKNKVKPFLLSKQSRTYHNPPCSSSEQQCESLSHYSCPSSQTPTLPCTSPSPPIQGSQLGYYEGVKIAPD